ncbi:MAG: DNA-directed RNA polymerase subunit B [Nanoarchaeota archaeon]|nr:DNA-directed RNA polymerase subunit B [Nanoarchaeota archaeon]
MSEVYFNGKFIGTVENGLEFTNQVRGERRKDIISSELNINYNEKTDNVMMQGDKGRVRRPLIIVKEGKPMLTDAYIKQIQNGDIKWQDLITQGIIEYIDALEEGNTLVAFTEDALTEEHTHLEISPLAIIGTCTSHVPFGNFNQSTRLNAGSKNQKQAIGFYAANFAVRMDMDVNLLHTPQIPIVKSIMHDITNYQEHPSGQNFVVAVMSYGGYNMEDASLINKGSIERGLARSSYFKPAITEELRYSGGLIDEICVPDKDVRGYKSEIDYRMLEEDGIIYPEAKVTEGDIIIGKTSPPRFLSSMDEYNLTSNLKRESSLGCRHGERGTVDFIILSENEEGNKLIQVRLRDQRIPEIGDKFTSRHGQKGVIGMVIPQADMPFTASGITPDLIFSPHGIPSRMTIAHLIELIGGKAGALAGRQIDGTLFQSEAEKDIRKELQAMGFRENGTETMYNGVTGKQFKVKIFIGNMYYLKLKHMVSNKIHSRARGPIQLLTRQPTEGRAKEGGLRLGEMEKDTFVAHGTSLLLKERFDSDKTVVPVCEQCGVIAIRDEFKDKRYCSICGENVEITDIELSYAFKLMLDELKTLGLYPKLELENKY